jgi:hypothetical protein
VNGSLSVANPNTRKGQIGKNDTSQIFVKCVTCFQWVVVTAFALNDTRKTSRSLSKYLRLSILEERRNVSAAATR